MEDYSRLLHRLEEANKRNDRQAMRDLVEQIRVILDGEIVSDSGSVEELRHSLDAYEAAAEDGGSPAGKAIGAGAFVGRAREIDRLKAFLLEALEGRGAL